MTRSRSLVSEAGISENLEEERQTVELCVIRHRFDEDERDGPGDAGDQCRDSSSTQAPLQPSLRQILLSWSYRIRTDRSQRSPLLVRSEWPVP